MKARAEEYFAFFGIEGVVLDTALCKLDGSNVRVCFEAELDGRVQAFFAKGDLPKDVSLEHFDEVNIVSGSCLFSAPAVKVSLADGGRFDMVGQAGTDKLTQSVTSIECDPELTAYELEAAARLTWSAVPYIKAALRKGRHVRMVLDVPSTQYYLYTLDGALNGLIRPEQCLAWFDEVDARSQRVVSLCRKNLARLLGATYDEIEVVTSEELGDVAVLLRDRMANNVVPTLAEIVTRKLNRHDPVWISLLGLGLPVNVQTFNGRSYSAALLRSSTSDARTKRFAIEVDNLSEGKIKEGVDDVREANPARRINNVALYPVENFFAINRGETRVGIYQADPGREMVFPDGTRVRIEDLILDMYPM